MAFEIPIDLIKQLQISLRNEAKISSYDPDDPSLPNLPTVQQSIADLDPSPPNLRCSNCRGRLLRGSQSVICVFCGNQQSQAHEAPPEPINFTSTFGCRWFLQSLHLDGSEIVGALNEANELNRGQSTPQEEVSLSEFLDLEIKWTDESENFVTSSVWDEKTYFFSEPKEEVAIGSNEFHGHEKVSLFETVKPDESGGGGGGGHSFSGWEADFQSSDSKEIANREECKTGGGPFVGSSVDLSAHLDSVFGSGRVKDDTVSSASNNTNEWFQDDLWSNSTSGVTGQAEQFEVMENVKDGGTVENTNLIQDNQWQTSSNKAPDNKTFDEDSGSFDASWNDFTSSTGAHDPLSTNKAPNNKTVDKEDDSFEAWNDFTSSTSVRDPSNGSSGRAVSHMGSSNRAPDNKTVDEDNDSFEAWNDFTSSTGAQDPSNSSVKQTVNHVTSGIQAPDNKTTDRDDDSFDAWNDFASSTGAQDPSNGSSKQIVNHVTSSNEARDNKTTDQDDDSFDAWNDFASSTGARDPSNDSSKQTFSQLTSSNKAPDNKTIDQDNDSFDAWNDFTSSTSAQDPFNSSWRQSVSPSFEQNSETNLFSTNNNSQNIDFGSFLQPDFFSGAPTNQNGSSEVKYLQSEASVSDRMVDARDNAVLVPNGEDVSNLTTGSKIDDVEMLMSQMHDLSFMLQSNLSVPSKLDGFSSSSKE